MSLEFRILSPDTRDLRAEVMDERGRLKVMPASYYAGTTREERAVLGLLTGSYVLPTEELIGWLRLAIGPRSALEIGAGNGVVAEALGIVATDNFSQERPDLAALLRAAGQVPVQYGANVQRYEALEAVKALQPKVVLGCWVTHKYDPDRHEAGGNAQGIVEEEIIANCETYILVGNRHVHRHKSIWRLPHVSFEPPWLYSRASNGSPDFIACWGRPPEVPVA